MCFARFLLSGTGSFPRQNCIFWILDWFMEFDESRDIFYVDMVMGIVLKQGIS